MGVIMTDQQPSISIRYQSRQPVDLVTFTNSLARFGTHYTRYAKKSDIPLISEEYRLFIKEVRHGSIEVDLVSAAGVIAGAIGDVRLFVEFGKEFISLTKFFLGESARPDDLDKRKCEDIRQIMAPIAENTGSSMNLNFGDNAQPTINVRINSIEANAIQNSAIREIELLKEPSSEIREEVLLRWEQAKNTPGVESGQTADRAIIDEIDEKARKVYFPETSRSIKEEMIGSDDNFFSKAYLVNVEVLVTQRKIVGYKIIELHDTFDLDE